MEGRPLFGRGAVTSLFFSFSWPHVRPSLPLHSFVRVSLSLSFSPAPSPLSLSLRFSFALSSCQS